MRVNAEVTQLCAGSAFLNIGEATDLGIGVDVWGYVLGPEYPKAERAFLAVSPEGTFWLLATKEEGQIEPSGLIEWFEARRRLNCRIWRILPGRLEEVPKVATSPTPTLGVAEEVR